MKNDKWEMFKKLHAQKMILGHGLKKLQKNKLND